MPCPKCRAMQLVEIALVLGGNRLTMHSCPACETRWWDREGERVGVDRVLDLAASH